MQIVSTIKKKLSKIDGLYLPFILSALGAVFSFGVSGLLATKLGSESYGNLNYYLSVINTASIFLQIGLPSFLVKNGQFYENKKDFFSKYFILFDLISLVSFPIYFVVCYFALAQLGQDALLIAILFIASFLYTSLILMCSFLSGIRKFTVSVLTESVLPKVLMLVAFSILIFSGNTWIINQYYVYVFAGIYLIIFIPLLIKYFRPTKIKLTKSDIKVIAVFFLIAVAGSLNTNVSKIMQGEFFADNKAALGIYSISMQIIALGTLFSGVITNISRPFFSQFAQQNDKQKVLEYYAKTVRLSSYVAIPCMLAFILGASNLLSLFGESYTTMPLFLILASIYGLIISITGPCGTLLGMTGHEKADLLSGIIGLVVFVAFGFILRNATIYAIPAALIISSALSKLFSLVSIFVFFKGNPFTIKTVIYLVIVSAASSVCFFAISYIRNVYVWLFCCAIVGILLILFSFAFSPYKDDKYFLFLKNGDTSQNRISFKNIGKKILNGAYIFTIVVFLLELFITSNGHYFEFTIMGITLTPRFIIFAVLMLLFAVRTVCFKTYRKLINPYCFGFILIFLYCCLSLVIGTVANGFSEAFYDFKSIIFLLVVLPIYDCFSERFLSAKRCFNLLLIASLVVSLIVLGVHLYLLKLAFVDSWPLDKIRHDANLFVLQNMPNIKIGFRNYCGVYYDGLFYVCLIIPILIVKIINKSQKKSLSVLYIILTIVFSYLILQSQTRGFIIYLFVACVFVIIFEARKSLTIKKRNSRRILGKSATFRLVATISASIMLAVVFFVLFKNTRLFDFSDSSTQTRIEFIKESLLYAFKPSILFGKGYGLQLPSKGPIHLEISFLEIFLKQGVFGVLIWLIPIFLFARTIIRSKANNSTKCMSFFGILLIYLVSLFNPHLCDVGGITVLLLSLFVIAYENALPVNNNIAIIQINSVNNTADLLIWQSKKEKPSLICTRNFSFNDALISLRQLSFEATTMNCAYAIIIDGSVLNTLLDSNGCLDLCPSAISLKGSFSFEPLTRIISKEGSKKIMDCLNSKLLINNANFAEESIMAGLIINIESYQISTTTIINDSKELRYLYSYFRSKGYNGKKISKDNRRNQSQVEDSLSYYILRTYFIWNIIHIIHLLYQNKRKNQKRIILFKKSKKTTMPEFWRI